jgi:hypothetical protein
MKPANVIDFLAQALYFFFCLTPFFHHTQSSMPAVLLVRMVSLFNCPPFSQAREQQGECVFGG